MSEVIRKALAHRSPEELLLIPVVLLIGLAILAQPTAITRLFETPYATPIPGDSPADVILNNRTPAPAPSPVTREPETLETVVYDRTGRVILSQMRTAPLLGASECPRGLTLREISVAFQPGTPVQNLRVCVDADGSVVTWDQHTGQRMRHMLIPGSVSGR